MNCPTCGDVEHMPLNEDEAHCECMTRDFTFWGEHFYTFNGISSCDCECHR